MDRKSQISSRTALVLVLALCTLPSVGEAVAVVWGATHGFGPKALRDGLDFWAGGYLALHGQVLTVFDPAGYERFIRATFAAKLPTHMWSYPPNYLLLAAGLDWLKPWPAVFAFDGLSLALLVGVLRLARQPWGLVAAVVASPVSLENLLEGQNAALMTAFIGGAVLLVGARPKLAGVLAGLASVKPQLGVTLPLFLLRRSRVAFGAAALAALGLGVASWLAFGAGAWGAFWTVTRPAMTNVLLTGKPPEFAGGLISVFATFRFLGVHAALVIQGIVTLGAIAAAARTRNPVMVLILGALASPYLHDYDLLGVALAVALMTRSGMRNGFAPGESVLFFFAWFWPGALPWLPQMAHATPLLLLLLLASAARYGRLTGCDSSPAKPGSPVIHPKQGQGALPPGPPPKAQPLETGPGL